MCSPYPVVIFGLYGQISQRKTLAYNGRISNFLRMLFIKSRVDLVQNLQGLSYEVCSTNTATIFLTRIICSNFGICAIIHQQLVATLRGLMRFVYIHVFSNILSLIGVSFNMSCYRRKAVRHQCRKQAKCLQ